MDTINRPNIWTDDRGQALSFVVKTVLAVGIVALLLFEFGAPVITAITLDNDAQNLVQDMNLQLENADYDVKSVAAKFEPQIEEAGIELRNAEIVETDPNEFVLRITIAKPARSMFADRISVFEDFYDVEVTAETPLR